MSNSSSCMISVNDIDFELQMNLDKYANGQMTGSFPFHIQMQRPGDTGR